MFVAVISHRGNTKVKITPIFKNRNKRVKMGKQEARGGKGGLAPAEKCCATTASLKQNASVEWQVIFAKDVISSGRNVINTQE